MPTFRRCDPRRWSTLRVVPTGLPLFHSAPGDIAVLVLHGYTGYCGDVRAYAQAFIEAGYAVSMPRLPGHGTGRADFLCSNWRDWLRRAVDAYLDLAAQYPRVVVAGLSMGGLLSILLAARFPVDRLILLAPALRTRSRLLWLTPLLSLFVGPYRKKPSERPLDNPDIEHISREYWGYNWPAQLASLWRLIRLAKRELPLVTAPTLIIIGAADGVVDPRVTDDITAGIGSTQKRAVVIPDATHVLTRTTALPTVIAESLRWLE